MVTYVAPCIASPRPPGRSANDEVAIDRWTNEGGAVLCDRKPAVVDDLYYPGRTSSNSIHHTSVFDGVFHSASQLR
jgi:hypothetical protein